MNKAFFKLPLYLLLSGIALRAFTFVTARIMMRSASEWTLTMGAWATGITAVIAAVLFVLIGLRLRREINRRTCFWSVLLVVGYSLFSLALEQAFQYFGSYSMLNHYMYLPLEIFTRISSAIFRLLRFTQSLFPYLLLSKLLPFLFLLFVKREQVEDPIEP